MKFNLLVAALMLGAAHAAFAAESIRWSNPWTDGQSLTYQSEGVQVQTRAGVREKTRHEDTTQVQVRAGGASGFVQTWTTSDSKFELLEGDPAKAALVEAAGKGLEGFAIEVELDKDGNYTRIQNIDPLATRMRELMRPAIASGVDVKLASISDATAREAARTDAMKRVDEALAQLTSPAVVEASLGRTIQTYNAFVGVDLEPEQWYEVETALENPMGGAPFPAKLQFTLYPSKDDADDVFLEWNSTIDPVKGAEALWDMVGKLTGTAISKEQRKGLPDQVLIRDEGFALFRRSSGVTEMFESTRTVKLAGQEKIQRERMRLTSGDHPHEWTTAIADLESESEASEAEAASPSAEAGESP